MLSLTKELSRRFLLTLCMGLALVFAFASPASTLDKLQHSAGVSVEHPHLLFGSLSMAEDHAADRHAADRQSGDNDEGAADHMPGSHHHSHSDGGAFLALAADASPLWDAARNRFIMEPGRQVIGTAMRGPDRPPKPAPTNA